MRCESALCKFSRSYDHSFATRIHTLHFTKQRAILGSSGMLGGVAQQWNIFNREGAILSPLFSRLTKSRYTQRGGPGEFNACCGWDASYRCRVGKSLSPHIGAIGAAPSLTAAPREMP